ncbi:MAG: hypothetical protein IJY90_02130 [Clostridia bacterium]|nr:hypothetical protein [Clostridia bacterium]
MANIPTVYNKIKTGDSIITQPLYLVDDPSAFLSFSTEGQQIFSITKNNNGKFVLTFTEEGKKRLNLPHDIQIELTDKSATMLPRQTQGANKTIGQEMELTVSFGGKQGTLKANALGVRLELGTGQTKDVYSTKVEQGLSIEMTKEAVDMILGDTTTGELFAKTPKSYGKNFPLPIFKLLVAQFKTLNQKTGSVKAGNFELQAYPSSSSKPHYIMLDHSTDPSVPYILQGVNFHRIQSFVALKDDKHGNCIALNVEGISGSIRFALADNSLSYGFLRYLERNSNVTNDIAPNAIDVTIGTEIYKLEPKDSSQLKINNPDYAGYEDSVAERSPERESLTDVLLYINHGNTVRAQEIIKTIHEESAELATYLTKIIDGTAQIGEQLRFAEHNNTIRWDRLMSVTTEGFSQIDEKIARGDLSTLMGDTSDKGVQVGKEEKLSDVVAIADTIFRRWALQQAASKPAIGDLVQIQMCAKHIESLVNAYQNHADYGDIAYEQIPDEIDKGLELIPNIEQRLAGKLNEPSHATLQYFVHAYAGSIQSHTQEILAEHHKRKERESTFDSNPIIQLINNMREDIHLYFDDSLADEIKVRMTSLDNTLQEMKSDLYALIVEESDIDARVTRLNSNLKTVNKLIGELDKGTEADKSFVNKLKANLTGLNEQLRAFLKTYEKQKDTEEPSPDKEEDESSDEDEKTDEKTEPEEISYKNQIENWTKVTFPMGAALAFLGCLIPGIGPLIVGLGLAVAGTSIILNATADKFKYKQAFGEAEQILTQAEQEALEDAVELGKFLENEQSLDLSQEKVAELSAKLGLAMQDEAFSDFTKAYDQFGVGFNADPHREGDPTRAEKLLGLDGHNIRESMQKGLEAIEHAPAEERSARVEEFIRSHFRPDITREDKTKLQTLLEQSSNFNDFYLALRDLNAVENGHIQLLTEQKVALGSMRDTQIESVISHPQLDGKRKEFIERYGSTIYRHFALDEHASQDKLNSIFAGLSEEEKADCLAQLQEIGATMVGQMDGVETIAGETREKQEGITSNTGLTTAYIQSVVDLHDMVPATSFGELGTQFKNYLFLQTTRLNNQTITEVQNLLDSINSDDFRLLPALSECDFSSITSTYQTFYDEASKRNLDTHSLFEQLAQLYTTNLDVEPVSLTNDTISQQESAYNSLYHFTVGTRNPAITRHFTDPRRDLLKAPNVISAELFNVFKSQIGDIEQSTRARLLAEIQPQFNQIVASREGRAFGGYTDEFASFDHNTPKVTQPKRNVRGRPKKVEVHSALEDFLIYQAFIAEHLDGLEDSGLTEEALAEYQAHWQPAQQMLEVIKNGTLASYHLAKAENAALGISADVDLEEEIDTSVTTFTDSLQVYQAVESIIERFPVDDREGIRKDIDKLVREADTEEKRANINAEIIKVLTERYGATTIETGAPTAQEVYANIFAEKNLPTLLEHLPDGLTDDQRREFTEAITAVFKETGSDKLERIREVLHSLDIVDEKPIVIGDTYPLAHASLPLEIKGFTTSLVSEWIKLAGASEITEITDVIKQRDEFELSTVAGNLGVTYSHQLYNEALGGERQDAVSSAALSPGEIEDEARREAHITSLTETEQRFAEAWRLARAEGKFESIITLFTQPAPDATEDEKTAYNQLIANLIELGISNKNIGKIRLQLDRITSADDATRTSETKSVRGEFNLMEQSEVFTITAKEVILREKIKLMNEQKVHRASHAITDHDYDYLTAMANELQVLANAETFTNKYNAILALGLSAEELKNVLTDFVTGDKMSLLKLAKISKATGFIFTKNDGEIIKSLGIKPDEFPTMSPEDVIKKVTEAVEAAKGATERVHDEIKDSRHGTRTADLETSKRPKCIKNRISILQRIFGNIIKSDEADKKRREESQIYGQGRELEEPEDEVEAEAEEHSA